jgi:hypothetical protein
MTWSNLDDSGGSISMLESEDNEAWVCSDLRNREPFRKAVNWEGVLDIPTVESLTRLDALIIVETTSNSNPWMHPWVAVAFYEKHGCAPLTVSEKNRSGSAWIPLSSDGFG